MQSDTSKQADHFSSGKKIRAFFLGSGELGIPALARLIASTQTELIGVATQPPRRAGRKKKLRPTPVHAYTEQYNAPLYTPSSVNDAEFLAQVRDLSPDIIVVASFGQILKSELLQLPPFGCLNIHPSRLPRHRGPSPLATTLLEGDTASGVSFMFMTEGVDSGPVYETHRMDLEEKETTETLESKLGTLAAEHIVECIQSVCNGNARPAPQDETQATYTRHVTKERARIDWGKSAVRLEREVRAYWPWPRSWFMLAGQKETKRIQLVQSSVVDKTSDAEPATVVDAEESGLIVACAEQALRLEKLIPAGKKKVTADEFLRGTPVHTGFKLN